jgi:DNA-binding LytR/AlgR family response regulator
MISCLIIDDEPVARNIIRNYCNNLPFLKVVSEFGNALEAKAFLSQHEVDLLFLDIHMPVLSGIGFLKSIRHAPLIIFTTAYHDYAVNAFDLNAIDYLLKPFSLERFIVAVDKARERIDTIKLNRVTEQTVTLTKDHFFIKAEGKMIRVTFNECLYIEAQGNYTKVVTHENAFLTKMTFSDTLALLPATAFTKVHRSFVINKTKVSAIEGNRVFVKGKEVPVAPAMKDQLLKELGIKEE